MFDNSIAEVRFYFILQASRLFRSTGDDDLGLLYGYVVLIPFVVLARKKRDR